MSWIKLLYDTYEACGTEVGRLAEVGDGEKKAPVPLLPIAHTTQQAHIEVTLDGEGRFLGAHVIEDKKDAMTVIPCTEKSAGRTGGPAPHLLHDKLSFIAGDYVAFGGDPKRHFYQSYMEQINRWCASPWAHPKVIAVRDYLSRGTLIADLVAEGLLLTDEDGKVVVKPEGRDKPPIYNVAVNAMDAFVRFRVHTQDDGRDKLWEDPDIRESAIRWYLSTQEGEDVCCVSGKRMFCSENNPSKLRNAADKAKLISANDGTGFTFRGRFDTAEQAVRVGYEVSQKAHSALRWLIDKQGYQNGSVAYVAWCVTNHVLPDIMRDTSDAFLAFADASAFSGVSTGESYAKHLRSVMRGYQRELKDSEPVAVMGIDSATPGRMSIIYYREMNAADFLNKLRYWHGTCTWEHRYRWDKTDAKRPVRIFFTGAPAPKDIVLAAYGAKANDKLVKSAIQRLVPCILERALVPADMVRSLFLRACNPAAMEMWEYKKLMTIACAVIKKHLNDRLNRGVTAVENYKEVWTMALNLNERDRSYLFGRLLAHYNQLESRALRKAGERRETNALKLKSQYKRKPASTADRLDDLTDPYRKRLGGQATDLLKGMQEITSLLYEKGSDDRSMFSDEPLDYPFLTGYQSQMEYFFKKHDQNGDSDENGVGE